MPDSLTKIEFLEFCDFLQLKSGIKLDASKHYLVTSRLNKLLSLNHIDSLKTLLHLIQIPKNSSLQQAVIDAMTTNETNWFRDEYPFQILTQKLLPEIAPNGGAKIWCAACSSGQEPYSIAMALDESKSVLNGYQHPVGIIGTDLSVAILKHAKSAEFDKLSLARGLSSEREHRYFESIDNNKKRVIPAIRNLVQFKQLNLKESYTAMGKFDVIFCRNVLIYFSDELKQEILYKLTKSLNPGGYLFLGASESASGFCDNLKMVRCNPGIAYQAK
jgi:chemotaxis protein methyltransferase CheR